MMLTGLLVEYHWRPSLSAVAGFGVSQFFGGRVFGLLACRIFELGPTMRNVVAR